MNQQQDKDANQIACLRAELAEARETIRQLREELSRPTQKLYDGIKLSHNERTVLDMIVAADGVCSRDRLFAGLYLSRTKEPPEEKVIDVMVCNLRKKCKPHRIDIDTVWGRGYTMAEESKRRLKALTLH